MLRCEEERNTGGVVVVATGGTNTVFVVYSNARVDLPNDFLSTARTWKNSMDIHKHDHWFAVAVAQEASRDDRNS